MAPLAKIPAVGLLYKNSVVNATEKNAILEMVAKYSIHRSSKFISAIGFVGNAREEIGFAIHARAQPNLDELSGFVGTRLELASSGLRLRHGLPPDEPLWLQSWKQLLLLHFRKPTNATFA